MAVFNKIGAWFQALTAGQWAALGIGCAACVVVIVCIIAAARGQKRKGR